MRFHGSAIRSIILLAGLAAACWLCVCRPARAQTAAELTPQEMRGKHIYLKGEGEGGDIKAVMGAGDLELPATSFPCANCHGLRGDGGSEGGLKPPPLRWESLTAAHRSSLTGSSRAAYNESTLNRAISMGVDASGNKLHPGMPRYQMSRLQMDDLIAYLKKVGKVADSDPGLGEEVIKVGAALPITGANSRIGEDVKAALEAYFIAINAQGGVYGRRLELAVEDSRGDAAGTAEATRRLVEQDKVFALVGSFEPAGSEATNDYLKQREAPLVGPVTLSPRMEAVPNRFVFYLLPSFADQSRSLVDFFVSDEMRAKGKKAGRLAVVFGESDFDRDAVAGVELQARLQTIEVVAKHQYRAGQLQAASLIKPLMEAKPDYVFFFGSGDDLARLAVEMERAGLKAGLASSALMVGRGAFALPAEVAARAYFSYPASLPGGGDFDEFVSLMQKSGVSLRSPAFQSLAYAAAKLFVEAARNSGRQLTRAALIGSMESLRDFKTGVLPPLTFGPNRRVGATGSYVVTVDLAGKKYVPVSERISPKGPQ